MNWDIIKNKIESLEELHDIAEVELMNGYSKGWYRTYWETENQIKVLKETLKELQEEEKEQNNLIKVAHFPKFSLCWSNYRAVILEDPEDGLLYYKFWSPELNVPNTHKDLMGLLLREHCDIEFDLERRWAGFYTYGIGNGDRRCLTLYGMSSDYPHTCYSQDICALFEEISGLCTDEHGKTTCVPF